MVISILQYGKGYDAYTWKMVMRRGLLMPELIGGSQRTSKFVEIKGSHKAYSKDIEDRIKSLCEGKTPRKSMSSAWSRSGWLIRDSFEVEMWETENCWEMMG